MRRPGRWLVVVAAALALAGPAGPAGVARAATLAVAPGIDRPGCGAGADPCRTIGYALAQAAAGDTLAVAAGTYAERLTLARDVTLQGAGAGRTILDGGGGGTVVRVAQGVTATVAGVTITGGAAGVGGGVYNSGTLTLTGSTLSGNRADVGGGVFNESGGALTLTGSTLSGNTARFAGGGVFNGTGALTLTSSTLSGDHAGYGGAVFNAGGTATLTGSIVAAGGGGACAGGVASGGHNLAGDASCALAAPGDRQRVDPRLGPLAANGGPTATHLPAPDSPAVDAGGACPPADQRGVPRPQGGACDSGAVELRAAAGLQYYPLPAPVRLLDTRLEAAVGYDRPRAPLAAGDTRLQRATGACTGIPAEARALVGNATVVNIAPDARAGYITLYPGGAGAQPTVASVNYAGDDPGETPYRRGDIVNNLFTVGLGDGIFNIYAATTIDLVIDLSGAFVPAFGPAEPGR